MTRQRKTPAQRAQEALEVAERHVARLKAKSDRLAAELHQVGEALNAAERRRAYLSADPALDQQPGLPIEDDDPAGPP